IDARPEIRNYFCRYAKRRHFNKAFLAIYNDTTLNTSARLRKLAFQAESPLLLTIYILSESDSAKKRIAAEQFKMNIRYTADDIIDFKQIIQALLQQRALTSNMLPTNQFHPLHFFLVYHSQYDI